MQNFEKSQQGKWKKIIAILFYFVVFGFVGLLVFANWKVSRVGQEARADLISVRQKIEKLDQEKKDLELQTMQSQIDLEKFARENLNLKKIGEKVVAFPDVK